MHPDFRLEVTNLKMVNDKLSQTIDKTDVRFKDSQIRIEKLQKSSAGYDDEVQVAFNVHSGIARSYSKRRQDPTLDASTLKQIVTKQLIAITSVKLVF